MFYRILISMVVLCLLVNFAMANTLGQQPATSYTPASGKTLVSTHALGLLTAVVLDEPADVLFPAKHNMHDYQLSVKDIERLSAAETIIWLGAKHEPGLAKLKQRFSGKHWVTIGSDVEHEWLRAEGAMRILLAVAGQLKPAAYNEKVEAFRASLDASRQHWQEKLHPFKETPFLVGHSAISVLARDLGLVNIKTYAASGSHGHHHGGTHQLLEIQSMIASGDLYCALEEPDVSFSQLKKRFPQLRSVMIDPMGAEIPASSKAFLAYYNTMAESLYLCLTSR